MTEDKKYFEGMIGIMVLFFTTYAVMKDFIIDSESTTKAFGLAVIFDVLIILCFKLWRIHGIKS